jgi:hypothetical protein
MEQDENRVLAVQDIVEKSDQSGKDIKKILRK